MFILNQLVNLWSLIAGIIVVFRGNLFKGILIPVTVIVLHKLAMLVGESLMTLHQKTMDQSELQHMAKMAEWGYEVETPKAWKKIGFTTGLVFFIISNIIILYFLTVEWK